MEAGDDRDHNDNVGDDTQAEVMEQEEELSRASHFFTKKKSSRTRTSRAEAPESLTEDSDTEDSVEGPGPQQIPSQHHQ